jgi:hypothetical protein
LLDIRIRRRMNYQVGSLQQACQFIGIAAPDYVTLKRGNKRTFMFSDVTNSRTQKAGGSG